MNFSVIAKIKQNSNYLILLSIITVCSYIFSINNAFVWDDEQFIYNNSYVKNFEIKKIFTENTIAGAGENSTYYRPLTTFSFAIDHKIWGLNPVGFHLTNTLLHLLTGLLLFFYLMTLGFKKKLAFVISAIFLVHPIQTEAVVYANSRGDSMYAFFSMFSLVSFALLLTKKYPTFTVYDLKIIMGKSILFVSTIVSYFLAILGKEIGIATLGLIGLTFCFWYYMNHQKPTLQKMLQEKNGIIIVILGIATATIYLLLRSKVLHIPTTLDNYFAGTAYGESTFVRLHTFTQSVWAYFSLIFFPYPLHMERNLNVLIQPVSFWLITTVFLVITLFLLSIFEYKKNKTVFVAFGSLWFFFMLVPVSGILPVNGLMYEHWLYIPIIGFCVLLYGITNTLLPRKLYKYKQIFVSQILPIILFLYILLSIRQNYIWGNPIRFYEYTLTFAQTARLHNNLAMAYAEKNQIQNAIQHYQKAIEVSDYYPQTHHNLANLYLSIGEIELAKKELATAIRMNDEFFPSYVTLIKIFMLDNDYENIEPLINKLVQSAPNNIDLQLIQAENLINLGKQKEGIKILVNLKSQENLTTQQKLQISNFLKLYK